MEPLKTVATELTPRDDRAAAGLDVFAVVVNMSPGKYPPSGVSSRGWLGTNMELAVIDVGYSSAL